VRPCGVVAAAGATTISRRRAIAETVIARTAAALDMTLVDRSGFVTVSKSRTEPIGVS